MINDVQIPFVPGRMQLMQKTNPSGEGRQCNFCSISLFEVLWFGACFLGAKFGGYPGHRVDSCWEDFGRPLAEFIDVFSKVHDVSLKMTSRELIRSCKQESQMYSSWSLSRHTSIETKHCSDQRSSVLRVKHNRWWWHWLSGWGWNFLLGGWGAGDLFLAIYRVWVQTLGLDMECHLLPWQKDAKFIKSSLETPNDKCDHHHVLPVHVHVHVIFISL